jgi:hypothetical protein
LVFDGVDDRIETNFSMSGVEATISVVLSPISSSVGYYIAQSAGGVDGNGRFIISVTNGKDFNLRIGSNILITTGEYNNWFILYVVRQNNGFTTFYKNGVVVGTFTNTTPFVNGRLVDIGGSRFVSDRITNSKIAQVSIYNRALTEAEVQQNFNATRSRFGI